MPERHAPNTERADVLTELFWSAVRAASPRRTMEQALSGLTFDRTVPVWVVALGKAANQMSIAAVEHLQAKGMAPIGGIVIVPRAVPPPHPALAMAVGDHPIPGAASAAAAAALAALLAQVAPDDEVWVLLSGGASSLAAAPEGPIRAEELSQLFRLLLNAGLDVVTMNTIRKRFLRWGAGRLAVAVDGTRIRNFVISDVIGDDLGAVGSGPCVPDPVTATQLRAMLEERGLWERIPVSARRLLLMVERDPSLETPKPGHPAFRRVERRIVTSNRHALDAAAARARELGLAARVIGTPLAGEAAIAGKRIALQLLGEARRGADRPRCLIWGGETAVTLEPGSREPGGRCQELALAAARELRAQGENGGIFILAAGTDGRDGETDAAGAVVDATTWSRITEAGRDPDRDLASHTAHAALRSAGALLHTDLTGTNVMDVVIGIAGGRGRAI